MEDSKKQIGVGDLVVLKSGGPTMTVRTVEHGNGHCIVWCDWFGHTDARQWDTSSRRSFHLHQLELAK